MASKKLFKGLAHDIAHHSDSFLSWLHPHLGKACRAAGVDSATLDLLGGPLLPDNIPLSKALEGAIPGWREKFQEMAAKHNLDLSKLRSATVTFDFSRYKNLHSAMTKSEFVLKDGTKYIYSSNWYPKVRKEKMPDTNLDYPDQFLKQNRPKDNN